MAAALDERGVYVAGFFYPVVPKGKARIRTQMSAALATADIDFAIDAFTDAGRASGSSERSEPTMKALVKIEGRSPASG